MIVAHVVKTGHDENLIGPQEFDALPPIGSIIHVLDTNSNTHRLNVDAVEMFGVKHDIEGSDLQAAMLGRIRTRILASQAVN